MDLTPPAHTSGDPNRQHPRACSPWREECAHAAAALGVLLGVLLASPVAPTAAADPLPVGPAAPASRIVVLGSSNSFGTGDDFAADDGEFHKTIAGYTAGWYPILRALAPGFEFNRYAFPAIGTREMHPELWPRTRSKYLGPVRHFDAAQRLTLGARTALFVGLHVNDVGLGIEPAETVANYRDILSALDTTGVRRAFVAIEPQLNHDLSTDCESRRHQRWSSNVAAMRTWLAEPDEGGAIAALPGPDLYRHFSPGRRRRWWTFGRDGDEKNIPDCHVHPNGFGYMEIAVLWCRTLVDHGIFPASTRCNDRPVTPALENCTAASDTLDCTAGAPADPDPGQRLRQFAWVVPAQGYCGVHFDIDRDHDNDVEDERVEVAGRFRIKGLEPDTEYTVCLVTWDGVQGSFFAERNMRTGPRLATRPAA